MRSYFPLLIMTMMLSACAEKHTITLVNDSDNSLTDKLIILSRDKIPASDNDNNFPVIIDSSDTLFSQLDDMDQDGKWDELLFTVNLNANQEKQLQLAWVDEKPHIKQYKTNIRFAKKIEDGSYQELIQEVRPKDHSKASPTVNYQMEGPAWENDKVAFRMYFDPRNGFDIFGKTTGKMILDQVGINQNYHELQDWGMDILKVNNSLGAGALALYWQDSLYRLADTDQASYKIISEGPLRSIFELKYKGWQLDNLNMDITQRITIEAGKYYYTSDVFLNNEPEEAKLVTGIVNILADTAYEVNAGGMEIMATHAKQAFNEEYLGMAIFADQQQALKTIKAPDQGKGITQTYALLMEPKPQPVRYFFFAGWELSDPSFADKEYFLDQVKAAAVQVTVQPKIQIN